MLLPSWRRWGALAIGCETEIWKCLIGPGHVPDLSEIETQVRRDRLATVS
jgi:hypothetical protein